MEELKRDFFIIALFDNGLPYSVKVVDRSDLFKELGEVSYSNLPFGIYHIGELVPKEYLAKALKEEKEHTMRVYSMYERAVNKLEE